MKPCCRPLFGRLGLWGVFPRVQGLEEPEEAGGLSYAAELDAEGLDLDEQVLDVDDLVPDQRLQEHTDQTNQPVLRKERRRRRDERLERTLWSVS